MQSIIVGSPEYASYSSRKIVSADFLGRMRIERYLLSFAREYNMTNTHWLRFRTLCQAFAMNTSHDYEKIAKEVMQENRE